MSISHHVSLTNHARGTGGAKSAAVLGSPNDDIAGIVDELVSRWQRGERPLAEEFLARRPEFAQRPDCALRLIYEEICQRYEAGMEVDKAEIFKRFPQWRAELEILLSSDAFLVNSPPPTFPGVGESFEGFSLLAELGRGGQGRVFLALEAALAGRPVVLKMTAHDGQEHLSLARLQHTHIVPLYWARDVPTRNLRVLCMPYVGGATLAKILECLKNQPAEQRTGQDLISALDRLPMAGPPSVAPSVNGPIRQFLARTPYVRALCWIGACLAEALNYAHERGLVHLDLKPSNVLLAADGQPMLLDFNLSQGPLALADRMPDRFGGTVDFMSPEQKQVMAAFRKGKSVPTVLDGRSDVYSLGLMLYEALGGDLEIAEGASLPPLWRRNPQVTPGLSDLIHKCLEKDPGRRYADAGLLAADLRRHLADLPLRGVTNRSVKERWQKWRRRRPHALALSGLALGLTTAVLMAGLIGLGYCRHRLQEAETALIDGRDLLEKRDHAEAVRTLTRGLSLAEGIPGGDSLREALRQEMRRAKRAQLAQELHLLADRMRIVIDAAVVASSVGRISNPSTLADGLEIRPTELATTGGEESRDLHGGFQGFWDAREQICNDTQEEPGLNPGVRTDMLDMAIIGAYLRVATALPHQKTPARQDALQLLAEAEALFGPSRVLYRERQLYAEALGWKEMARAAQRDASRNDVKTPWEHFALGLSFYREKDFTKAGRELQRAVDLQPQDFWSHFYLGKCAYRLGRFEESRTQFSICIALAPDSAESYYNRALVQTALLKPDEARKDYDLALERNPKLAAAALNRGILNYQANRLSAASADLRQALDNGADPAVTWYNLALVQLAQKDRHSASVSLRQALRYNPGHKEAGELRDRLEKVGRQ